MDDLDDLLAGGDRTQYLLADGLLGDLVNELADDRERDIGLKQRDADLAHCFTHIRFVQRATTAQAVEDPSQPIAQTFEHAFAPLRRSAEIPCLSGAKRKARRRAKPRRPAGVRGRFQCFFVCKTGLPLRVDGQESKELGPNRAEFLVNHHASGGWHPWLSPAGCCLIRRQA